MELYAQAYQQLASISAILGGLAFTAAAALLAVMIGKQDVEHFGRAVNITVGTAVISSVFFIIAALMWSFMSADLSRAAAGGATTAREIISKNWIASLYLIGGCVLFFTSLGASGWIASRKLGIITTTAAAWGGVALIVMLRWFADID